MLICPKCNSTFFDYDPDVGFYQCRNRNCFYIDRTKNGEFFNKEEDIISYNVKKNL